MTSELGKDLPLLVALVRTKARFQKNNPEIAVDRAKILARLRSDTAKRLAGVILGQTKENPEILAKAEAIHKLALD